MKRIKKCRCCKSIELALYLDLGKQPLANSYHKGIKLKTYPLQVLFCKNCFHSQLSVVVNPKSMFEDYLFVTGTSKTLRDHHKELAKDARRRVKSKNPKILDIACNDGTLLQSFRDLGCKVYGVDPAKNLREVTKTKKLQVYRGYWGRRALSSLNTKFNIITATNVFAHVDRVRLFLKYAHKALLANGVLIIEFPYMVDLIKNVEFDTVYHEHLSYFLVNSFKTIANKMDFSIVDILETPVYGGSIRFFLKKGKEKESIKVKKLLKNEKANGLWDIKTYKSFAKAVNKNKLSMQKALSKFLKQKKKIIGYGASAKGNTMLNYFDIRLDYIIDDNPLKWGYLTPGKNILIKSPESLKSEKQDLCVVILAWNYYAEISQKIKLLRKRHAKDFGLVYIPSVKAKPLR